MSTYKNFLKDFPSRCIELLAFSPQAKDKNLDVTLLLAVAGQVIIVPLERFDIVRNFGGNLSKGARKHRLAFNKLKKICDEKCALSRLFCDEHYRFDPFAWRYVKGTLLEVDRESIPDSETNSVGDKECKAILEILRHAFAHGNLRTKGDPIAHLIFLSREDHGPRVERLQCDLVTFRRFLESWVKEIKRLDFDKEQVIEWRRFMATA